MKKGMVRCGTASHLAEHAARHPGKFLFDEHQFLTFAQVDMGVKLPIEAKRHLFRLREFGKQHVSKLAQLFSKGAVNRRPWELFNLSRGLLGITRHEAPFIAPNEHQTLPNCCRFGERDRDRFHGLARA